jgi:hypothetical protein
MINESKATIVVVSLTLSGVKSRKRTEKQPECTSASWGILSGTYIPSGKSTPTPQLTSKPNLIGLWPAGISKEIGRSQYALDIEKRSENCTLEAR